MNFADKLQNSIERSKSYICAGFDPNLAQFPKCILDAASQQTKTEEDAIFMAIKSFYELALEVLSPSIAAVKPNIAFFEQYGLGGLRALFAISALASERDLPVILDGKRGDIGSTAEAYSNAYLGQTLAFGKNVSKVSFDAITLNPFLGFDTLEPFLKDMAQFGKGVFVLVKTSNPGSASIQDLNSKGSGKTVSVIVADWLNQRGQDFVGSCGFSALGAVVGATYPEQARQLRALMPKNLFLIPGLGAQGGSAKDALAGFATTANKLGGGIINVSRGLFSSFSSLEIELEAIKVELRTNIAAFNRAVTEAL